MDLINSPTKRKNYPQTVEAWTLSTKGCCSIGLMVLIFIYMSFCSVNALRCDWAHCPNMLLSQVKLLPDSRFLRGQHIEVIKYFSKTRSGTFGRATPICFFLTNYTVLSWAMSRSRWTCYREKPSHARCISNLETILNSCLCRKPERKTFLKCVFSSQYLWSF